MRNRPDCLLLLVMLLLAPSLGLAQGTSKPAPNPDPLHFKDFIDWYNSIFNKKPPAEEDPAKSVHKIIHKVCIDGKFYNQVVIDGGPFGATIGPFLTPLNEDCKESTDPQGNPAPNTGSEFPTLYKIRHHIGGVPPPAPGGGFNSSTGSSAQDAKRPVPLAASADRGAGSTAYSLTLPYRPVPFDALFNKTDLPADPPSTCASDLKPSMFTVNHTAGTVTRSDLCTDRVLAKIGVPPGPLQVAVTPDGAMAVVTSYYNGITFINTDDNSVIKTLQTPSGFFPSGLAISPDGSYALVTNYYDFGPSLAVFDLTSLSMTGNMPLDTGYPQSVFLSPDGLLAWVTFPWSSLVEVVDVLSGTVVHRVTVIEPFGVAFNATGTTAYVTSGSGAATIGSVLVFDTTDYSLTDTVPAGGGASDIELSPSGNYLLVNNNLANSITLINAHNLDSYTFPVPGMPRGSVVVPAQ